MKVALGILITLLVLAIGAIVYIYSGSYNVAATDPHNWLERWVLMTTMRKSIEAHAQEQIIRPDLDEAQLVEQGFRSYRDMCVVCHGAPGVERGLLGKGLTPEPPSLVHAARRWSSEELFWIVKHGIKMTGMPAWGPTHDDKELWAVIAFVERLPEISPQDYQRLSQRFSGQDAGHGHEHGGAGAGGHHDNSGMNSAMPAAQPSEGHGANEPSHGHDASSDHTHDDAVGH